MLMAAPDPDAFTLSSLELSTGPAAVQVILGCVMLLLRNQLTTARFWCPLKFRLDSQRIGAKSYSGCLIYKRFFFKTKSDVDQLCPLSAGGVHLRLLLHHEEVRVV